MVHQRHNNNGVFTKKRRLRRAVHRCCYLLFVVKMFYGYRLHYFYGFFVLTRFKNNLSAYKNKPFYVNRSFVQRLRQNFMFTRNEIIICRTRYRRRGVTHPLESPCSKRSSVKLSQNLLKLVNCTWHVAIQSKYLFPVLSSPWAQLGGNMEGLSPSR